MTKDGKRAAYTAKRKGSQKTAGKRQRFGAALFLWACFTAMPSTECYAGGAASGETGLFRYVSDRPVEVFSVLLTVMAVMAVLFAVILYSNVQARRKIVLENQRYEQISELSDECIFQYDYLKDELKLSEKSALTLNRQKEVKHFIVETATQYRDNGGLEGTLCEWICAEQDGMRDVRIKVQDGMERWFRVVSKVIRDKSGAPVYALGKLVDIQEEKEEKELLVKKSQKDSLTDLYNAATSRRMVAALLERWEQGEVCALLIADVDKFKQVNDQYGHLEGDHVLTAIACLIQTVFAEEDIKGRLGGDEFIVYIRHAHSRERVEKLCGDLLHACRQIEICGKRETVSMSVGVAMVDRPGEFNEWYQTADKALYRVKECGRDNFGIL